VASIWGQPQVKGDCQHADGGKSGSTAVNERLQTMNPVEKEDEIGHQTAFIEPNGDDLEPNSPLGVGIGIGIGIDL
jgi:hypothetical protein